MSLDEQILRALERERLARKESERILELKSLEIYEKKLEIEALKKRIDLETSQSFSLIDKTRRIQEEVFESHPFSILIYSLRTLKILSANNTAVAHYGFSKEEFTKLKITDLHDEQDAVKLASYLGNFKSIRGEQSWVHVKKNGDKIAVKISGVTIEFENEKARTIIIEDITEQNLLREKNEIQHKKYVDLIEKSSDLIFGVSPTGNFIFVNSVTCSVTNFLEEELLSMSFIELIREDYRKRVLRFYQFQLESNTESTYTEFPIVSKNNEVIWLGQNVNVSLDKRGGIEISAIARVITERRAFEKAIHRSEDKYRSIIENMELGLLETDRNGIIVKAYKSFCNIVGYTPQELQGTDGRFMLHEEDEELLDEQQQRRKEGHTGVYEIRVVCKDGSQKWVLISGAPFYDQNNRLMGSMGIHLDITRRKNTENELLSAKNIAEKSMRAKDVFLANISHEIRTPLNAIVGLSQVLRKSDLAAEEAQMVNQISVASDNLLSLINDLLLLSKAEADGIQLQPDIYSVHNVIREAASMFSMSTKEKNIDFVLNLELNPTQHHEFDRLRFVQVLQNLVSNAIKFTNVGEVRLSARQKGSSGDIEVKIEDTGIGIPEDELRSIFDGFTQGSNNNPEIYGGTGLGLSIVNNIVKLMNGTVQVERLKKGTCFTLNFSFPVKEKLNNTANESSKYKLEELLGVRILVAEDNNVNQLLIKKILSDWELDFTIVDNGNEALEALQHEAFDLVLMDIRMPIMNGMEATKRIRNQLNNYSIRIIALTANALEDDNHEYWEVGFNDVLLKPFVQQDLLNVLIDNACRRLVEMKEILLSVAGNDQAFAETLRLIFIEDSTERLDLMRQASLEKEIGEIASIAHSMKPALAQLAAKELQRLNVSLEKKEFSEDEIDAKVKVFYMQMMLLLDDLKKVSF